MRQVLRIEHPSNGAGPCRQDWTSEMFMKMNVDYYQKGRLDAFRRRHNHKLTLPQYDYTLLWTIREDEFCAFLTLEQLQDIIKPEELAIILSYGFKVYILELSDYREGVDQVLYQKECVISQTDITDLFL